MLAIKKACFLSCDEMRTHDHDKLVRQDEGTLVTVQACTNGRRKTKHSDEDGCFPFPWLS